MEIFFQDFFPKILVLGFSEFFWIFCVWIFFSDFLLFFFFFFFFLFVCFVLLANLLVSLGEELDGGEARNVLLGGNVAVSISIDLSDDNALLALEDAAQLVPSGRERLAVTAPDEQKKKKKTSEKKFQFFFYFYFLRTKERRTQRGRPCWGC